MTPGNQRKRESAKSRSRAEERLPTSGRTAAPASDMDAHRRIQEPEVHQLGLERQYDELRQAKAELEANYDKLYDSAPFGYFTLGSCGEIEKTNLTGAGMLGQSRAWLVNRRFAAFVAPGSLPGFNEFLHRVFGGFETESCTVTLMKGGITPVTAHIEATGMGPNSSFHAVVVDITSAEQARLALREREAHLKLALAASDMGVWEWERDTGEIYWSPECLSIFGVDCLCPTLDILALLLHPSDALRVGSMVSQALADGKEQSIECRIIRPNGEIAWIFVRGQVQYDNAGKALRLIGIVQDSSRRKRTEDNACPWPEYKTRCSAKSMQCNTI
jgi:PAS domain S-box-containing protein